MKELVTFITAKAEKATKEAIFVIAPKVASVTVAVTKAAVTAAVETAKSKMAE